MSTLFSPIIRPARFIGVFGLAVSVSFIPFVSILPGWLQTFFHEISHGLAAVITGGAIERIVLRLDGSGVCYTTGGFPFLIAFSGYAGGALWGSALFVAASSIRPRATYLISMTLCLSIIAVGLLWARDLVTIGILAVLATLTGLLVRFPHQWLLQGVLQVLSAAIIIDALLRPLALLRGNDGDAAHLASLTYVPGFVWITIWEALACACIWTLWRSCRNSASPATQVEYANTL